MTTVLDGRAIARSRNKALKRVVDGLERKPGLAVVLVGSDPASQVYVRRKGVVAGRIGFHHRQIDLPADTPQDAVLAVLDELNADAAIDGILVQLPLPRHLDTDAILARLDPDKDVDGLTLVSMGRLAQGRPHLVPCTPRGILALLDEAGVTLEGRHAVVLGRSAIVGRPLAMLLEQANCTVTVCHSRTVDVASHVRRADLLIAAVGVPELVRGDWLTDDTVIIDVGVNRLDDGRLVGDVAFDEALPHTTVITPVPGGVGPMTIAMLMDNTLRAYRARDGA